MGARRVGVERALLHLLVEGVEEVGRARRPVGHEAALDIGTGHEPGQHRIEGDPPPVGGEVDAGLGEHPRLRRAGLVVEIRPAAALQYDGMVSGRALFDATNCPVHSAGRSAATSPATTTAVTSPTTFQRRNRADTAPPRSTARPSTTSGVARLVLRSANPTVDPVAPALTSAPSGEGFDRGLAPTAMTVPISTSATKKARSRHRNTKAARKAVAGTAKLTASNHSDVR